MAMGRLFRGFPEHLIFTLIEEEGGMGGGGGGGNGIKCKDPAFNHMTGSASTWHLLVAPPGFWLSKT